LEVLVRYKIGKLFLIIGLLLLLSLGSFEITTAQSASGEIWTSINACGDKNQSNNVYNIGDVVFINGENFDPGTYQWSILGSPGNASCDPDQQVAVAAFFIDESGAFCFPAYTIESDDCGTYTVTFGEIIASYQVTDPQETEEPTVEPTEDPTEKPTEALTEEPTMEPTEEPTDAPTEELIEELLTDATEEPTLSPTAEQTEEQTEEPTIQQTETATEEITEEPTEEATEEADRDSTQETPEPTQEPTQEVTPTPTPTPTEDPEPDEKPGASGPSLIYFIIIPTLISVSGMTAIGFIIKNRKNNMQ